MQDFGTKTDNSPPPGGQLSAAEFNNLATENENAVLRGGQALSGASATQLAISIFLHSVKASSFQDSGAANAYVATPISGVNGVLLPATYAEMDGSRISFIASNANSGNSTLNIGQTTGTLLGTKKILTIAAAEIPSGSIASGMYIQVQFNSALDGGNGAWVIVNASAFQDYLNTTRIDVASAATVNLTSSAPDTRHINITGTTTITAFTVAVGKCYFISFAGSLTLTNNASIVTQTGANIVTVAGDTCIVRATAANVVEILCYSRVQRFTQATAIATTSGTSHDFTGIPSWVNQISIILSGVSLNGTTQMLVQIGSGSIETTGYLSYGTLSDSASTASTSTAGYIIRSTAAANLCSLVMTLTRISGNVWVSSHVGTNGTTGAVHGGGNKTIGGVLDRLRLTTVNGTDVFDAGLFNIIYEG